jgi:alpha/beta superfamily hydrolase
MKTEVVHFPGSEGQDLAARLDTPAGDPRAYAVFAHCFTCGKDFLPSARIARALTDSGIAVLRFDFTGLGESAGDFGRTTFSSNVDDLVAAAAYLRTRHAAPSLLIGHSLGGAAVLAAASRIPEVRGVVSIAAPSDPAHVTGLFESNVEEIEREGHADVRLSGRTFRIGREFLQDVSEQNLTSEVAGLGRALLVMHSPQDNLVPVSHAARIFAHARHPKTFVSLDDADHLLTRPADAAYAASVIGAWATRYLAR